MAIRYEVLSAPSLRDRLQVLSKRLFEVDATPRNLPRLVADAAKYINDAGFLFDGSSDGRDRWPAGWEYLWPFNLNDRWLLQWGELSKDVDYARDELESSTVEVDRDTVLAWLQAAFASHLQRWLSQCVPGMSLNPGSAFVPIEWRGKFALRKYHWKHQRNLAASAVLIGPSEYQQFADDVATVCAYLAEQLTVWLAVTESPAPIAPASPSLVAPSSGAKPSDDEADARHSIDFASVDVELTNEDKAIALAMKDHGSSVADIAAKLGVRRQTPYRWLKFIAVHKGLKSLHTGNSPRHGSKDRDGNLEAEDDSE